MVGRKSSVGHSHPTASLPTAASSPAAAIEKAKVIASKSPIAVISTKHILNRELRQLSFPVHDLCLVPFPRCSRPYVSFPDLWLQHEHSQPRFESVEQGLQYVAAWNMYVYLFTSPRRSFIQIDKGPCFNPVQVVIQLLLLFSRLNIEFRIRPTPCRRH